MIRYLWRCPVCGLEWRLREDQFPIQSHCGRIFQFPEGIDGEAGPVPPKRQSKLPCVHRGAEMRRETCQSCSGHVEVKVFGCNVFAECTIAKPLAGIQCCESCPSYQAGESATASATGG